MWERVQSFCLFACYSRSGHSLVGTILDAHPNAAVAHEGKIFDWNEQKGLTGDLRFDGRGRLFKYLASRSARHAEEGHRGRRRGEPFPLVAGASNGHFDELRVIGVKRGQEPPIVWDHNPRVFDQLAEVAGVPVRLVHVYRNPWDNIASMARTRPMERVTGKYFRRAQTMCAIKERVPLPMHDLALEDLIAHPRHELRRLLNFFELPADDDFIEKAVAAVDDSPTPSRREHEWTPEELETVARRKREIPWLARYPDTPD